MKLVKFQKDWADELDAFGFRVFTDEEWADYVDHANKSEVFEMWFGTNEGWDADYGETPSEIIQYDMQVIDVSDADVNVLTTLFPGGYFGVFPDKECFTNQDDVA